MELVTAGTFRHICFVWYMAAAGMCKLFAQEQMFILETGNCNRWLQHRCEIKTAVEVDTASHYLTCPAMWTSYPIFHLRWWLGYFCTYPSMTCCGAVWLTNVGTASLTTSKSISCAHAPLSVSPAPLLPKKDGAIQATES